MTTVSEKIWLEHSGELKRFVLSKIKDKDTGNDIMQDVFIKMHAHINDLKDAGKVRQWLYQVTRNTINDHFRKQKINIDASTIDLPEEPVKESNDAFLGCMQPHINKLPLIYKEALEKVELGNYSQLQLAKELNISYSGAKSRVQRARELLKSYFEQCCQISSDKYGNILSYNKKHNCTLC